MHNVGTRYIATNACGVGSFDFNVLSHDILSLLYFSRYFASHVIGLDVLILVYELGFTCRFDLCVRCHFPFPECLSFDALEV